MELRWITLRIDEEPPIYAIPIEGQIVVSFRVLQYRVLLSDGNKEVDVWSDWEDVPMAVP